MLCGKKSIRDDVSEYFTTHSRDDMESYINWISEFDTLLGEHIPVISPMMWRRFTEGSVNRVSSFNGMPMHPNESTPIVSGSSKSHGNSRINLKQLNKSLVMDLLVQKLYQIQNPNESSLEIIYDYKATIKKLKRELNHTQVDFVKYNIPIDYVKFFVTKEGYVRDSFLRSLSEYDRLMKIIPKKLLPLEDSSIARHNGQGLNHAKYINKT